MPGTHSAISKHMVTRNGSVLTSGGAKNLAKGQFTIVNSGKAGVNGAVVVSDFASEPKSTVYEMRLGKHGQPNSRTAANSKPYSSQLFKITDIVDMKANFPKVTKQTFDDIIIGYDGINADTAITMEENQTTVLDVILWGDHVGYVTGDNQHVVKIHFGKEVGDSNKDVIERAAKELKNWKLPMGVPLTELIDIKVVNSDNLPLDGTPYVFSTLTLTDAGESNDLAAVQAQYPLYRVYRDNRNGLVSTYGILHPQGSALAAYTTTVPSYLKDCEDCAAGYDLIDQGVVYTVSIEDDGVDLTTTVDNVPGFVSGSVVRKGQDGTNPGRGIYTVVTDNALTDAEISDYVATAGAQSTAIITLVGDVRAVCYDDTVTSTAWVDGDVCYATVESYNLQLKDGDCDGSRLAEVQAAYPNLVIEEGSSTGTAVQTVTLSGTSGTGNINVGGVDYLATYDTSPTVAATNFVTTHAAAILAATGLVVTSNAAIITFTGNEQELPVSFANVTTNLAGAVSAIDYTATATTGGCQRVYTTTVLTDIVCDECDDIFLQGFTSEAPQDFDFTSWERVEPLADTDAKMGIRLTGKPFKMIPTDIARDQIPFYDTSTRIAAFGGYVEEENFSFSPIYRDIFNVKRLSRAKDRDNLGYYFLGHEEVSKTYFDGETRHIDNQFARAVLGEESLLVFDEQYVTYEITIQDSKPSQGVGRHSDMANTYVIDAPFGQHTALEDYLNKLAAKAGIEPMLQVVAE